MYFFLFSTNKVIILIELNTLEIYNCHLRKIILMLLKIDLGTDYIASHLFIILYYQSKNTEPKNVLMSRKERTKERLKKRKEKLNNIFCY